MRVKEKMMWMRREILRQVILHIGIINIVCLWPIAPTYFWVWIWQFRRKMSDSKHYLSWCNRPLHHYVSVDLIFIIQFWFWELELVFLVHRKSVHLNNCYFYRGFNGRHRQSFGPQPWGKEWFGHLHAQHSML